VTKGRAFEIMKLLIVGEVQSPKMMLIHYEESHLQLTMKSDEHFLYTTNTLALYKQD
jgi:hypothetical protein